MSDLNMQYFKELRRRINQRLEELETKHREAQINDYPWLYGALGEVPSEVMFICGNPSLTSIRRAHVDTVDGREPDIEAQWWGGRKNNAAKRFRVVLRKLGLKSSRPDVKGGWKCYITNVVKEANIAGADQGGLTRSEKNEQAAAWADILIWEYDQVRPSQVFAVGGDAYQSLHHLQRLGYLSDVEIRPIGHYTARGSDEAVMQAMMLPLQLALEGPTSAR
jgi:hypothetical protein